MTRQDAFSNVHCIWNAKLLLSTASTSTCCSTSSCHPQNVVWMLVTNAPLVKSWVTESYSNITNTTSTPFSSRTILVTQSRDALTKGSPSTADVAEGFLDWDLIGESDVVVSDDRGPSFGITASFRTGQPHYKVPQIED